MRVFNFYGFNAIIILLGANLFTVLGKKVKFTEYYHNKIVTVLEQIGRFGCIITMIINIPYTCFGFFIDYGNYVYPVFTGVMVAVYIIGWLKKGEKESVGYALLLSIVPSVLFLIDGILILNVPLIVFSLIFAPTHILISYKNSSAACKLTEKAAEKSAGSVND